MSSITLSKGERYTFVRQGSSTVLTDSTDSAEAPKVINNMLILTGSIRRSLLIDTSNGTSDAYIQFKSSTTNFLAGILGDKNQFTISRFTSATTTGTSLTLPGVQKTVLRIYDEDSAKIHLDHGLVVTGSTIFRPNNIGSSTNLFNLYPAPTGEAGSLAIGWNKSSLNGEIDFISGRAGGSTDNGGGFAFYDLPKYSVDMGGANYYSTGFLICSMKGPTADAPTSGSFKVEGRIQANSLLVNTSTPAVVANVTQVATFNGQIKANLVNSTSDKRLKQDILPIKNALNKILMLNGVTYNWNKEFDPDTNLDDHNHIGLLAQDVEKIIPQIVHTDNSKNQLKSMTYTELIPVLIEAIKEQQTQINELKTKLKDTPYG